MLRCQKCHTPLTLGLRVQETQADTPRNWPPLTTSGCVHTVRPEDVIVATLEHLAGLGATTDAGAGLSYRTAPLGNGATRHYLQFDAPIPPPGAPPPAAAPAPRASSDAPPWEVEEDADGDGALFA